MLAMKSKFHAILLLPTLALVSACASTPDPAEVCSAEWITPRATKAVDKIQARTTSSIGTLRKASESLAAGKKPGLLQMLALNNALNKMKKELTNGQGIRDLKTVARTCNDPNLIRNSMRDLLERQGVSNSFIRTIESSPIYESLISSMTEPDPVTPNG